MNLNLEKTSGEAISDVELDACDNAGGMALILDELRQLEPVKVKRPQFLKP